jgi:hypothetical protein
MVAACLVALAGDRPWGRGADTSGHGRKSDWSPASSRRSGELEAYREARAGRMGSVLGARLAYRPARFSATGTNAKRSVSPKPES